MNESDAMLKWCDANVNSALERVQFPRLMRKREIPTVVIATVQLLDF